MEVLASHDYPGNIRELENVIEYAFVLCQGGVIELRHLPENLRPKFPAHTVDPARIARTLKDAERWAIVEALKRNHWNRQATADELGIHKTTLFRKIASLGIELPSQDGRSSRQ